MRTTNELNKKTVGADPVSAQKGITLIALIITIIVMLILVSVTITMAVNGGLFDYAKKAVGETKNAIDKEQELANGGLNIAGTWYNSIDEYVNKETITETHNWTRTGDDFKCSHCNAEYTMGEVVNYQRARAGETVTATLTAAKSGLDRFYEYEGLYPEGVMVDEEGNQIIEAQDVNWVVLGIEDTNKDDIYETLLITTETYLPSISVEEGMYGVNFYGAAGYNNAVDEINRICRELYSNGEYGDARGMTIEDVNSALRFIPKGGLIKGTYPNENNTPGNLTTKLRDLPEVIWNLIKTNKHGICTPDGTNTEIALGNYELNGYAYGLYNSNSLELLHWDEDIANTITEIESSTIFGPYNEEWETFEYCYFLASRGVSVHLSTNSVNGEVERIGKVDFGVGQVEIGSAGSLYAIFDQYGSEDFVESGLRPVVSLKTKLPAVKY